MARRADPVGPPAHMRPVLECHYSTAASGEGEDEAGSDWEGQKNLGRRVEGRLELSVAFFRALVQSSVMAMGDSQKCLTQVTVQGKAPIHGRVKSDVRQFTCGQATGLQHHCPTGKSLKMVNTILAASPS